MAIVVPANEEGRKFYEQAEVKPAKWLMPDGSIVDEFPMGGGSSADLEDNKTATIDVSTYTEPVEIEPTEGKDGMKKTTVTLSNIPSGGSSTAYGWRTSSNNLIYLGINIAPENATEIMWLRFSLNTPAEVSNFIQEGYVYTKISDTSFSLSDGLETSTFTRDSTSDFTLWQFS